MGDPHVISALMRKRATLAGDLKVARREVAKIQADLAQVDRVIRMFDPSLVPEEIPPVITRGRSMFRPGELTRGVLNILRTEGPLSVRDIATRLASLHRLDMSDTATADKLTKKVHRVVSTRNSDVIAKEMRGQTAIYRLKV